MKFHKQRHVVIRDEDGQIVQNGSCYPTVIACILDLELDEVPHFQLLYFEGNKRSNLTKYFRKRYLGDKDEDQCEDYQKTNYSHAIGLSMSLWDIVREHWMASIGYKLEIISDIDIWVKDNPNKPYLVSGKSSRGVDHVCVYQNGILYHDPHPSGEGLVELWERERAFETIVPI